MKVLNYFFEKINSSKHHSYYYMTPILYTVGNCALDIYHGVFAARSRNKKLFLLYPYDIPFIFRWKLTNKELFKLESDHIVKQNLIVYGKLYSVPDIKKRIEYLSEKLRLEDLLNRITGELSSGQKNRVSLAKALINNPKVLLLDEPTASLDPEIGDFVRTFLENYKEEKKISILLASHNMNEVTRLCESILMMKDGIIIDNGSPEELINKHGRQNLEEVFLKLSRSKNEFN